MKLLQSRKFWLLIIDTVVALSTYFVGKYAGAASQDILTVIAALQPIFVMAVVSIAVEDAAQIKAGTHPTQK